MRRAKREYAKEMAASPEEPSSVRKDLKRKGVPDKMLPTPNAVYLQKSKGRSQSERALGGSSPSQFYTELDKRSPQQDDPSWKLQYDAENSQREKDVVAIRCRALLFAGKRFMEKATGPTNGTIFTRMEPIPVM